MFYLIKKKINRNTTIGEFKILGRELVSEFNLTDRQAIDILDNKNVAMIIIEQNNNYDKYDPNKLETINANSESITARIS